MRVERVYDLKLASGRVVDWVETSPEEAIASYQRCHPGEHVIAWRHGERHGLFAGLLPILEPGDRGW